MHNTVAITIGQIMDLTCYNPCTMHILITGGAGFIGSHVSEQLYNDGHQITIIDNLSTGKITNISSITSHPRVRFIHHDIRTPFTDLLTSKPDTIVHLAAIADVQQSITDPSTTHDVNVSGTLNVLETCRQLSISKFIFASSAAVYGDVAQLPITENTPHNPQSPYGLHKSIGEQYAQMYQQLFGINYIILRFFNVYGPRQNASGYAGLITAINQSATNNIPMIVYGDGKQTRDLIHVSDVVRAICMASTHTITEPHILNIGSGVSISVNEAISVAERIINRSLKRTSEVARNEIRHSRANIQKAKDTLNWHPRVSLEQGLSEILKLV